MQWLKSVLREILGLFVDDGRFALAILAWLGAVWMSRGRFSLAKNWDGLLLFGGLALILIENAWRCARSSSAAMKPRDGAGSSDGGGGGNRTPVRKP